MNRRLFAGGLVVLAVGVFGLGYALVTGVVHHPAEATEQYGPQEYLLLGGSFLSVTVGVVVLFRSFVELQ